MHWNNTEILHFVASFNFFSLVSVRFIEILFVVNGLQEIYLHHANDAHTQLVVLVYETY